MINLASARYNMLSGSHDCDCGNKHVFDTPCILEHGAFLRLTSVLATVTPPLSRVALIYDDEALMKRVHDGIKRDYRAVSILADDDKRKAELVSLPEDTKLLVATGSLSAINAAKYLAFTHDLPLVIAALPQFTMFTPRCIMRSDRLPLSYEVKPPLAYIYDLDVQLTDKEKASLFGTVAARLNSSFESYVATLVGGRRYCPYISGALSDIAAKTILFATQVDKTSPQFTDSIAEAALKLALIAPLGAYGRSGETQCAITYAMMNEGFTRGELEFVFSAVLCALYHSHISRRKSFVAPPDNNFRLEHISELFGISEMRALRLIRPQINGREAAIIEYKFREYRSDLLDKLSANINLFRSAFRTFKRLYDDGGYALGELGGGDVSLSIALSPDIVPGEGMLTTLKRLGELDGYIV